MIHHLKIATLAAIVAGFTIQPALIFLASRSRTSAGRQAQGLKNNPPCEEFDGWCSWL